MGGTSGLAADEAAERQRPSAEAPTDSPGPAELPDDDDLDELDTHSNHVVDLIHAGRLDEAEERANDLLRRYPGLMDGDLRLAMVFEARGNSARAADHYRKAAACLDDDCEELRQDLLQQANKLTRSPE
ncbi:hypothetical protein ACFL59_01315 [Planctomycetota bacterium]